MKTVQVSRRSASYRRRLFAAGALSAVVALSHVDSAAAIACATDTFYDGSTVDSTGSNGGVFDTSADCTACPTGTTAAAVPDGSGATFCEGVKTGYAGTAGTVASADATITGCDSGYYIATIATGAPGGGNTNAAGLVCTQVPANKYFTTTTTTPLQVVTAEAPSACPNDSTSTAGSTVLADCKCDAEYKADTNSACVACPTGTDWISAPSVGTTATFCEAIKAGYYGTLGSSADATLLTACPSGGWTSAGLTSGGPTTIADCFQAASGITPDKTMYGKSGDNTNVYLCPTGTVSTVTAAVSTASFCSSIAAGYYGTAGNTGSAHASSLTACPANSDSAESAATTTIGACECAANFYPSSSTCVACASGTTRAGTVSVTGTATCSAAASAGASTPTAVALAAAAAVPLLL